MAQVVVGAGRDLSRCTGRTCPTSFARSPGQKCHAAPVGSQSSDCAALTINSNDACNESAQLLSYSTHHVAKRGTSKVGRRFPRGAIREVAHDEKRLGAAVPSDAHGDPIDS